MAIGNGSCSRHRRGQRDLSMLVPVRSRRGNTMLFNKPHLEFHKLDMGAGWETPPGYPSGIKQKILASDLDER
jgi:hypothetical protein